MINLFSPVPDRLEWCPMHKVRCIGSRASLFVDQCEVIAPNDLPIPLEGRFLDWAILHRVRSFSFVSTNAFPRTSIDKSVQQFLIDRFVLLGQGHQCQTFVQLVSRTDEILLGHGQPNLIEKGFAQTCRFKERSENRYGQTF